MLKLKRSRAALFTHLPACLLCISLAFSSQWAVAEWYSEQRQMMGTAISVELWAESSDTGKQAIAEAMAAIKRIDLLMNPLNPSSELAAINQAAASRAVKISAEMLWLLQKSLYFSQLSGGAFDISFAPLGWRYDYRRGKRPNSQQIAALKPLISYRDIVLDPTASTVFFRRPGMQLDLGGIAKGYAVDLAIQALQRRDIVSAIVTAGGDSRIIGDRGDRPWQIGIKHPRRSDEHVVMIPLQETAISTSGDYERFFEQGGVRYHHIISPQTGDAARGVQSVSVLAAKAVDSDALSTTLFVLGVKEGLKLANSLDDIEAIIIDDSAKLHYSAGLLRQTTE